MRGLHADAFGIGIGPNSLDPGKMFLNSFEDPHKPLLGYNKGVPIHEEDVILTFHVPGSKQYIAQDNVIRLYLKPLVLKGPTKSALVV